MLTQAPVQIELSRGFQFKLSDGKLELRDIAGNVLLRNAFAYVTFRDGSCISTTAVAGKTRTRGKEIQVRVPGTETRPGLEWRILSSPKEQAMRLTLTVTNTTARDLQLDRLVALDAPFGFADIAPEQLQVFSPGYMSWSAHVIGRLPDISVRGDKVLEPMVKPSLPDGVPLPWVAHLQGPQKKQVLVGFTSSARHVGVVELGQQRAPILAWNDGEGITLKPGESRQSEELFLLLGEGRNASLKKYAAEVARHKGIRKLGRRQPPAGWCSWSAFFEHVTWQDILDNLDAATQLKRQMPLDYFQLDDFYTRIGDWLDLRDEHLSEGAKRFGGGAREREVNRRMQKLAGEIRARGFMPGLWLAPLLVNGKSKLFQKLGERSDWFIRDEKGNAVNSLFCWDAPNYALDVTNPQVAQHVRRIVRTIVYDWGFKLLKLDFLYAGALHGTRFDPNVTSVEAYNRFVQIVNEAKGDAKILYCGAPFIESAGGDYMRIGPDVADRIGPQWYPPTLQKYDRSAPSAINSVCESLSRAFWLELLYDNVDADSLITRLNHDSRLTPAERSTLIATTRATNSVVSLGDDLREWTEDQTALLSNATSLSCQAAEPAAFDKHGRPSALELVVNRDLMEVTLVNWKSEDAQLVFDPNAFDGLNGMVYSLEDVMTGERFGPNKGGVVLGRIPAHGARVFRVITHS